MGNELDAMTRELWLLSHGEEYDIFRNDVQYEYEFDLLRKIVTKIYTLGVEDGKRLGND
jgi:hypothetical protein